MKVSIHCLAIAAAIASVGGVVAEAHADPVFEWEYSINSGAFVTRSLATASGVDSVSLEGGKLSIVVNYSSNNPGGSTLAELANQATATVTNSSTSSYTVVVNLTETGFTAPSGLVGHFTASIGSVSVQQWSSHGVAANATVGASAYLDDTNAAFGTKYATNSYSESASSVTTPTGLSSETLAYASNPFTPGTPFSMTVSSSFDAGQNTIASAYNDATFVPSIPEPSSMSIAVLGAIGMIGYGWRRHKARRA